MERLTVFDGEFWVHKDFPPVGADTVDEFVDCVKALAARLAAIEDILRDSYDLDKLRELADAVRAKRCFALPVLPDLRPGMHCSECFILLDSGEIVSDNVCSILIGPDGSGDVVMLFDTFDNGYFVADDVGKCIFRKIEDAQKAASALKGKGDDR